VAIVACRIPGSVALTPGSVALTPDSLVSVYREFNTGYPNAVWIVSQSKRLILAMSSNETISGFPPTTLSIEASRGFLSFALVMCSSLSTTKKASCEDSKIIFAKTSGRRNSSLKVSASPWLLCHHRKATRFHHINSARLNSTTISELSFLRADKSRFFAVTRAIRVVELSSLIRRGLGPERFRQSKIILMFDPHNSFLLQLKSFKAASFTV
jgi:hypothetical protein